MCRLRPPSRVRLEVISGRSAKLSRTLTPKRSISTTNSSFRSSSIVTQEINSVSANDKEHKSQETILSPTQPTDSGKDQPEELEDDKDAKVKSKIVFSSYLYEVYPEQHGVKKKLLQMKKAKETAKEINEHGFRPMKSHALKYFDEYIERNDNKVKERKADVDQPAQEEEKVHFPFAGTSSPPSDEELSTVPNKFLPRKVRLEKLRAVDSDETLREKVQNAMGMLLPASYLKLFNLLFFATCRQSK